MVNRTERKVTREIDKIAEAQPSAVISYVSKARSFRTNQNKENPNDELIGTLADAHENRRAQQVSEWEQMRRTRVHSAA